MTTSERVAISGSWIVLSVLGSSTVCWFWTSRDQFSTGVARAMAFVGLMVVVHFIGYTLYERQGGDSVRAVVAPAYFAAARSALFQNLITLVLSALLLDGGLILHVCVVATLAFWLAVTVIVVRRPATPTAMDLDFVRHGFLLVACLVFFAGQAAWRAMGRI